MRPRGCIRQALSTAACEIAIERPSGFTWRDVALRAQVGWVEARQCVRDMARAGELQRVGYVQAAHARRPMTLYAPPASAAMATAELEGCLRAWLR